MRVTWIIDNPIVTIPKIECTKLVNCVVSSHFHSKSAKITINATLEQIGTNIIRGRWTLNQNSKSNSLTDGNMNL